MYIGTCRSLGISLSSFHPAYLHTLTWAVTGQNVVAIIAIMKFLLMDTVAVIVHVHSIVVMLLSFTLPVSLVFLYAQSDFYSLVICTAWIVIACFVLVHIVYGQEWESAP